MPEFRDNVSRTKAPAPLSKSIFVGLRAADVFWQYNLLHRGWAPSLVNRMGGHAVSASQIYNPITILQLQPYYGVVTLLAVGSSIKQIAHITLVFEQEMSVGSAVAIASFNTIFNSINTLLSVWTVVSPMTGYSTWTETVSSPLVAVGVGAYLVGILTEAVSEFQRKSFKQDPDNTGKPYGGGLFSLATNINYGGYTVWRGGYALVCGGVAWGMATFAFFF